MYFQGNVWKILKNDMSPNITFLQKTIFFSFCWTKLHIREQIFPSKTSAEVQHSCCHSFSSWSFNIYCLSFQLSLFFPRKYSLSYLKQWVLFLHRSKLQNWSSQCIWSVTKKQPDVLYFLQLLAEFSPYLLGFHYCFKTGLLTDNTV